jgi:hypothetical protein
MRFQLREVGAQQGLVFLDMTEAYRAWRCNQHAELWCRLDRPTAYHRFRLLPKCGPIETEPRNPPVFLDA